MEHATGYAGYIEYKDGQMQIHQHVTSILIATGSYRIQARL